MDGIELDFFRHPVFFKRHAWGEPLLQTDLDYMYVFNVWRTGKDRSPFLGEIGELASLQMLDKVYYASVLAGADPYSKPKWWVAGGGRFQSAELSTLSPDRPVTLNVGEPLVIPLRVGENVLWGKAEGIVPEVKLDLQGAGSAFRVLSASSIWWWLRFTGAGARVLFTRQHNRRDDANPAASKTAWTATTNLFSSNDNILHNHSRQL
jgi:hypothetical protein